MIKEFFDFLRHYGVVGLAIAVIIGGKLNLLVTSFVNDILTPLILQPALNAAGVKKISQLSYNGVLYGKFMAASLDFVVVAFIVFIAAKKLMRDETLLKK
ncbi:MAG TPA: MscL family protein [Bacteriovoracaceae bacterium]|nr:MscL family protein [Bacteriovoracaceae bacterium]